MNAQTTDLLAAIETAAADFECIAAAISSILQADDADMPARASGTLTLLHRYALDRQETANKAAEAALAAD